MQTRTCMSWLFLIIVGFLLLLPNPAQAQSPGDLDLTFDGDGLVTTDFGDLGYRDEAYAIALQPDGKILAAGYNDIWFALARYHPNGTLDTSFSGDGKVRTEAGYKIQAMVLQPNGKIIVAGSSNFTLARYNPDGNLDPTFGSGGIVTTIFGGNITTESAYALALQPDGRIVAAGTNGEDFAIARYNPDGTPDNSFDDNGRLVTNIRSGLQDGIYALAIQPDGKIVAAGHTGTYIVPLSHESPRSAIVRYNPDGSLDPTFDGDGRLITAGSEIFAIALQPDGRIVTAGSVLARYHPNGSLDPTFDGDGIAGVGFNSPARALALQPNGKIIIAGANITSDNFSTDFAVARYFSNGALDFTFDGDGVVTSSSGAAYAVAVQPDGKIVAAGTNFTDFALVRLLAPIPDLLPIRMYLPLLVKR